MFFSLRHFKPLRTTLSTCLQFRTSKSPSIHLQLLALGSTVGCIGSTFALAENSFSSNPTRSSCKYLICGGGVAAQEALQTFADKGEGGNVLLISPELRDCSQWKSSASNDVSNNQPEERLFSRMLSTIADLIALRSPPELVIGPRVTSIDPPRRVAKLDDGSEIVFERCLIAVGTQLPDIPIGKVVSHEAAKLVSGATTERDWQRINSVLANEHDRVHLTVVGGGWLSTVVGAALVDRGADVTFSHAEPSFLARYLPKYLSQELLARFLWQSAGGVDTLAYSALRYVVARKPLKECLRGVEAEVHVGTVFDAFSIVDFRTDHVVFAPTLPPKVPIAIPTGEEDGGLLVNAELAVASDVYVAGAAVSARSGIMDCAEVMRWSADHARATGRHAALNMLGGREPYSYDPMLIVDLPVVNAKLHMLGDVDGSAESFGYFVRSPKSNGNTAGGRLEKGVVFYVTSVPPSQKGGVQRLQVTGVVLWEGVQSGIPGMAGVSHSARELLEKKPMTRPELEKTMDGFATEELGISLYEEREEVPIAKQVNEEGGKVVLKPLAEVRSPSPRVIWRRHRAARTVRVRKDEILWVEDEWLGTASPEARSDKMAQAYSDLLRKAANKEG